MRPEAEARADREARRIRRVTRTILAVGFSAALCVYVADRVRPANPLGYEPLETKKYLHDLEAYGGKANVIAAEFREWFADLWYGERLAYTLVVLTLLAAGAARLGLSLHAAGLDSEDSEDGVRGPSPGRVLDGRFPGKERP